MTGKERLAELAKVLDAVKPERFDLDVWIARPGHCGTTACAVGHAVLSGRFTAEGLGRDEHGRPTFQRLTSWGAVTEFFEVDTYVAYKLFSPDGYPGGINTTPNEVARAIRNYLEDVEA